MRYCEVGWWTRRSRQAGVPRTAWYMYHRPRKTPKLGENLENFVENSTNIYRERSGPPDPTRPDGRRDAHPTPGAVSTSTTRPAPGARLAPPARPWPGTLPLAARPRPTPGPATRGTRRPARSHPPTRARPRRPGRGPHASPSVAGRTRTHRAPRSRSAPDLPRTATPDGIGCDPSPPPPSPRRGRAARRAGGAGRVRVSRSRADCAPRRARRAPAPSAPRRVCSAAPVRSPRRAGGHLRQYDSNSAAVRIRRPIRSDKPYTHLTRSRPPRGTAEARAPAAAHVTVAAPVAENGASPLVAPLSSPPVSRVSIYSCTAVSVTLNHTRHLLLSARLSLAARLCVRASQAGRWSRVAAGGWLEVEVAISPVHL